MCINFTPALNFSLEMNSATLISYMTWKVLRLDSAFVYFGNFSLLVCSFDHITTSGLKSDIIFELCAPIFL